MRLFNTFRKIINLTSCNLPIFTSLYYKDYIGIFVTSYRKTRSQINDMFLFQRVIITMWHYNNDIILSTNFDLKSFRFGFEICPCFFYGIGFEKKMVSEKVLVSVSKKIGIEKVSVSVPKIFGIEKKFRYWFRKNLVSKTVSVLVSEKFWCRKKYRYWYRKKIGIEKSIGIGIEKNWYRKKVSDSVSFRFWVSSHTAQADQNR